MSHSPVVWCAGELMWDFLARAGVRLEQVTDHRRVLGGAAANVALELRQLGHAAGVVAWLPDDALGHSMRRRLSEHGVLLDGLSSVAGRTGLVCIEEDASGEQRFTSHPARYDEQRLPLVVPPQPNAAALHIAALRPDETELLSFAALARQQRAAGRLVTLDLNARPRPWRGQQLPAAAAELWREVHVMKASVDDLAVLGLDDSPSCQRALLEQLGPAATLIVTRGTGLVTARGGWGAFELPCEPLADAGSMGAGDAFCAGLLAARLSTGWSDALEPWRQAIRRAQHVAAERLRQGRITVASG